LKFLLWWDHENHSALRSIHSDWSYSSTIARLNFLIEFLTCQVHDYLCCLSNWLVFLLLQVVPFLLLGAEYGHLITIWRLCAIGEEPFSTNNFLSYNILLNWESFYIYIRTGFFISFSVPKLYSCYSAHINKRGKLTPLVGNFVGMSSF